MSSSRFLSFFTTNIPSPERVDALLTNQYVMDGALYVCIKPYPGSRSSTIPLCHAFYQAPTHIQCHKIQMFPSFLVACRKSCSLRIVKTYGSTNSFVTVKVLNAETYILDEDRSINILRSNNNQLCTQHRSCVPKNIGYTLINPWKPDR